jgi:hypothetical protein
MQMTAAFAGAVTVSIPIFALAAGAEARTIRERLKRPDEKWEAEFARYRADHELDLGGQPADVFAYFRGVPALSKAYLIERAVAIGAAVVWLVVFVLLTIAELRCLAWLADGARPGGSGLATFTLTCVGVAMVALIIGPAIYLAVPLLAPVDVIPQGLKDAVAPKLADKDGRGFMKKVFSELEGAITRAAEQVDAEPKQGREPAPGREAGQPPPPGS